MKKHAHNFEDKTGKIYGRLKVLSFHGISSNRQAVWNCLCKCGNKSTARGGNLQSGKVESCGCLQREGSAKCKLTHGESSKGRCSKEFSVWMGMKSRCSNKNLKQYKDYGGRGIIVCDQWLNSFPNFLKDMGRCPHGMTLERKNNNGNYTPSNCKWATMKEQSNNKRNNRRMSLNGITKTLTQWEIQYGMKRGILWSRINLGWSFVDALFGKK